MTHSSALIINAHPDDSEMAMGGTLLLLKRAGYSICNVSLTRGESGTFGSSEIREKEFRQAQKYLGAEGVLLDFPDTALENSLEARLKVVELIRKVKPDIIFAPYLRNDDADFHGMNNRDHAIAGQITAEAVKLARLKGVMPELPSHCIQLLLFYMVPPGTKPSLIVDISEVVEEAKTLIRHYESQLSIPGIEDILMSFRKYDGQSRRTAFAESFISEMPLLLSDLSNLARM